MQTKKLMLRLRTPRPATEPRGGPTPNFHKKGPCSRTGRSRCYVTEPTKRCGTWWKTFCKINLEKARWMQPWASAHQPDGRLGGRLLVPFLSCICPCSRIEDNTSCQIREGENASLWDHSDFSENSRRLWLFPGWFPRKTPEKLLEKIFPESRNATDSRI